MNCMFKLGHYPQEGLLDICKYSKIWSKKTISKICFWYQPFQIRDVQPEIFNAEFNKGQIDMTGRDP